MDEIKLNNMVTVREFVKALESIVEDIAKSKLVVADEKKKNVDDYSSLPESVYVRVDNGDFRVIFSNDDGKLKPFNGDFDVVYARYSDPSDNFGIYAGMVEDYNQFRSGIIEELSSRLNFS